MAREPSKNMQPHKAKTQEKVTSRARASKADTQINARTISLSRAELFCAGIVFLIALLLYSWTLAPTVTLTDSGELIVVARGLGIAHPPGVPLWIILAHLASLMPFGNIAVRINFSSALFAALACAMLTLTVAELTITASYLATSKRRKKVGQQSKTAEESGPARLLFAVPAVGAGLLMAFSRTLWSYATITEVYTLNAFLVLLVFFLVVRWRRRIIETRTDSSAALATHDKWIYAAAFVFGLAMGVHHVTVALTLPAIAVVVYRTEGLKFFTSRRLLYAALIS